MPKPNPGQLYRINDAVRAILADLGYPETEDGPAGTEQDRLYDDLTHLIVNRLSADTATTATPDRDHPNCVRHGLAAVHAVHPGQRTPDTVETVDECHLADVIADVLHLAVAAGLDPDDVLDHGRSYFDSDHDDSDGAGPLDTDQPEPVEELCKHPRRELDVTDGLLHCTVCGDVTVQGAATHRLLRQLADHAKANDGHLVAARPVDDGQVLVGYEFGHEAPDSDMAGGAAYAITDTLSASLAQVAAEVGLPTPATAPAEELPA